jgi:predicted nucleic acid-binding protein
MPTIADTGFLCVSEILDQYADARIDFGDATIVALAERLGITRILTTDQRHFRLFRPRHCTALEILP